MSSKKGKQRPAEASSPQDQTPKSFDGSRAMLVVLAVYFLLALAYISVTPFRTAGCLLSRMTDVVQQDIGAPDERQHTNYIRHLVSEKAFPVFDPKSPDLYENYQSHQPPLYYLIAAPAEASFRGSESGEMWALRLVNVILGGFAIWGIFVGIRRLTASEVTGVAAAAITAFLPMFLALSGAVSNDMALFLVGVAVMNVIALGWQDGWNLKNCLLLGLALGLGILTKSTATVLIPVAVYGLLAKKQHRPTLRDALMGFALALLIALPWLIRNQSLYGDPLAVGAFQQASVGNLPASDAIERAGGAFSYWFEFVFPVAIEGFWGVFGYFDVFLPQPIYLLCNIVAILLLGGFVWKLVKSDRETRKAHWLLVGMVVMVFAAFVSYNLNYFQAQGRYLYPAIFAIAGMLAIGLNNLAGSERRSIILASAAAGLLVALNVYATFYLLPVAFEVMQQCVSSNP